MDPGHFSSRVALPTLAGMRIVVIGAHGTIGAATTRLLRHHGHAVTTVGRTRGDLTCDIRDEQALRALWEQVGEVDAVVSAAGSVRFAPFAELTDADFAGAWDAKGWAQINLVRWGLDHVAPDGSFTLISGIPARDPVKGGVAAATVNGAVEAFVRAAAIEIAPRRINVVSPSVVTESLDAFDAAFPGFPAVPADDVAKAYRKSVEGGSTGQVITLP